MVCVCVCTFKLTGLITPDSRIIHIYPIIPSKFLYAKANMKVLQKLLSRSHIICWYRLQRFLSIIASNSVRAFQ